MEVSGETIRQRLELVDSSQHRVQVATTWVLLHSSQAEEVARIWAKLISTTVNSGQRLGLLFLCHEIVKNCRLRTLSADGASKLMEQFSLVLPTAFDGAIKRAKEVNEKEGRIFTSRLRTTVQIWGVKRCFAANYLSSLRASLGIEGGSGADSIGASDVPPELVPLVKIYSKYQAARGRFERLSTDPNAAADIVDAAKEDYVRRLIALNKHFDRTPDSDKMGGVIAAEMRRMCGEGSVEGGHQPLGPSDGSAGQATAGQEADPLASFFD